MPLNHSQDVVEVVGDPGGQLTYRFHFLRLPQLVLEFDLLGEVLSDDQDKRLAIQFEQLHGQNHVPQLAGLGSKADGLAANRHLGVQLLENLAAFVGLIPNLQFLRRSADQLRTAVTRQLAKALVGVHVFLLF